MKARPILFSAPMVRAILDGRKSQTRRLVKPPRDQHLDSFLAKSGHYPDRYNHGTEWCMWGERGTKDHNKVGTWLGRCPYGEPGDGLWVRETHGFLGCHRGEPGAMAWGTHGIRGGDFEGECGCEMFRVAYAAGGDDAPFMSSKGKALWRPSIHMPRWASRITLRVTDVRVERLQDISEEDARWEGVERMFLIGRDGDASSTHRNAYMRLWDSINGVGAWDANPWVWRVAFERVTP